VGRDNIFRNPEGVRMDSSERVGQSAAPRSVVRRVSRNQIPKFLVLVGWFEQVSILAKFGRIDLYKQLRRGLCVIGLAQK
jgi:hypothetical protein